MFYYYILLFLLLIVVLIEECCSLIITYDIWWLINVIKYYFKVINDNFLLWFLKKKKEKKWWNEMKWSDWSLFRCFFGAEECEIGIRRRRFSRRKYWTFRSGNETKRFIDSKWLSRSAIELTVDVIVSIITSPQIYRIYRPWWWWYKLIINISRKWHSEIIKNSLNFIELKYFFEI